jgi:hypothetical protein
VNRPTLLFVLVMSLVGCIGGVAALYGDELDRCIEQGQKARSVPRYTRCANAVDVWMCETRDLRCVDGGAP